jgi:hypothetical protein
MRLLHFSLRHCILSLLWQTVTNATTYYGWGTNRLEFLEDDQIKRCCTRQTSREIYFKQLYEMGPFRTCMGLLYVWGSIFSQKRTQEAQVRCSRQLMNSSKENCAKCGCQIIPYEDECWHYDDQEGCHWLCLDCHQ